MDDALVQEIGIGIKEEVANGMDDFVEKVEAFVLIITVMDDSSA